MNDNDKKFIWRKTCVTSSTMLHNYLYLVWTVFSSKQSWYYFSSCTFTILQEASLLLKRFSDNWAIFPISRWNRLGASSMTRSDARATTRRTSWPFSPRRVTSVYYKKNIRYELLNTGSAASGCRVWNSWWNIQKQSYYTQSTFPV